VLEKTSACSHFSFPGEVAIRGNTSLGVITQSDTTDTVAGSHI
jgi:hypothetical protein